MPLLKPFRGLQLNKNHHIARGLVGCWLLNEVTGNKVFDLSANNNTGIFAGNMSWSAGKFGSCLNFDGSSSYVDCGNNKTLSFGTGNFTIEVWIKAVQGGGIYQGIVDHGAMDSTKPGYTLFLSTGQLRYDICDDSGNWTELFVGGSPDYRDGKWHQIVWVYNGSQNLFYSDGSLLDSDAWSYGSGNPASVLKIGRFWAGDFSGLIDNIMIWKKAFSAKEIALLYREPFCMFERVISSAVFFAPIIDLSGSSTAQSTTAATAKLVRRFKGASSAASETSAILKIIGEILLASSTVASSVPSGKLTLSYRGPWLQSLLKIERQWLTDALFNGMTANAFKLGTALTGGWFWMRRFGCSALYRGPSVEKIDFTNTLTIAEQDAGSIAPPDYLPHHSNSTYFYVVRRFNICGYQERTLAAAVKVAIDADGNLIEPKPNNIFVWRLEQVYGNKIQLIWFYCPLEQESKPESFRVYHDGGTGLIDYENPIATISYRGRKFYIYQTDALTAGRYLFAVRAEDAAGIENNSLAQLAVQLNITNPDAIDILSVQNV